MHPKTRCTIAPLDWLAIACTWQARYRSFPLLHAKNVFTPPPPAHPSPSILLDPSIRRPRFFDEWACKWKEKFYLGCTIVSVRPSTSGELALSLVLALPSLSSTTLDHASMVLRSYEELVGLALFFARWIDGAGDAVLPFSGVEPRNSTACVASFPPNTDPPHPPTPSRPPSTSRET